MAGVAMATYFTAHAVLPPAQAPVAADGADSLYFRNCGEARAAGEAPIRDGEPGYRDALDHDGDGVACEPVRGR